MSRREQILDRAATLFASRGFHGVSVDDVGAACGICGPALYRHFASKDAMLAEMLEDISEQLLGEARARRSTSEDRCRRSDGAHRVARRLRPPPPTTDHRPGPRLELAAAEPRATGCGSCSRAYIQLWVDSLTAERPDLDRRRAQAQVRAVFGLLNSTPRSSRLPDREMRQLLTDMAWAALRA